MYPPLFCKLRSSSNPTNKNLTDLGLEIQTAVFRQRFRIRRRFIWTLSSQWPVLSPPKLLTFPPESPSIFSSLVLRTHFLQYYLTLIFLSLNLNRFWSFRSSVTEDSIRLGYGTSSQINWSHVSKESIAFLFKDRYVLLSFEASGSD
jgi:hypothetical protein